MCVEREEEKQEERKEIFLKDTQFYSFLISIKKQMKLQEFISVVINPDTSAKEMHDAIIKGCLRGQNKVIYRYVDVHHSKKMAFILLILFYFILFILSFFHFFCLLIVFCFVFYSLFLFQAQITQYQRGLKSYEIFVVNKDSQSQR